LAHDTDHVSDAAVLGNLPVNIKRMMYIVSVRSCGLSRDISGPASTTAVERTTPEATAPDEGDAAPTTKPRSLTWAFGVQMVAGVGFEPTTFGL